MNAAKGSWSECVLMAAWISIAGGAVGCSSAPAASWEPSASVEQGDGTDDGGADGAGASEAGEAGEGGDNQAFAQAPGGCCESGISFNPAMFGDDRIRIPNRPRPSVQGGTGDR
jgi:hypothetical protein